jgi:hypothetical protein
MRPADIPDFILDDFLIGMAELVNFNPGPSMIKRLPPISEVTLLGESQ